MKKASRVKQLEEDVEFLRGALERGRERYQHLQAKADDAARWFYRFLEWRDSLTDGEDSRYDELCRLEQEFSLAGVEVALHRLGGSPLGVRMNVPDGCESSYVVPD